MKKVKYLLLAFMAVVTVASCDTDFAEVNTDPNNPTDIPAHLLLGNILRTSQNILYAMQYGGDMGGGWAQHWTKVQYNDEMRYIPRRGVIDNLWDVMYASVISDAKTMEQLAEAEGNQNLQGVALILQAYGYQTLTDLYGPIPFTEANDPTITQPAYDSGEVVYQGVLEMLRQASELIAAGNGNIPASSDLIYGGDVNQWEEFANSLRFRALMRISDANVEGVNVSSELQALMNSDMFDSNLDTAELIYLENAPDANPIYETVVFGNRPEYKVSEPLVDLLSSLNDPRLEIYAAPAESDGAIRGKPAGYRDLPNEELGFTYANISGIGDFYLDPTLPAVLMSYAQLQFLKAEAANEGLISGGTAQALEYYREGIRASFAWHGLDATAYLEQPILDFTTQADARAKIARQEWLALYGQGFEAWTEWRRTGFPALVPAIEGDINEIPSRLYYPTTENSLNIANYQEAVNLLEDGDALTSPIFWMN